ncbi:hypothetical protein G5T42_02785 [Microbacterium sp. 4R-513]|uniref:hypothetical protein n=1 Tax=Microbacterium sp. 4R-513 TaxID=2567934 RepID=UPI0013E1E21E|nr:hypothetical protein [Microbacterium sp. 4R-513]QIG38537.1 hypothetical protein G5T42_02785 [Microbacterium sp. 4R-513]
MPRTTPGSAEREDGPLIAAPADPRATTGLTRRGWVLAIAAIAILALVAGTLALLAVVQLADVPAAALTPAESEPIPSAPPAPEAVTTAELDGQAVWLAKPATAPVGVAVLFPGAADDPASLLKTATAQDLLAAGWAVSTGGFHGPSWGSPSSSKDVAALRGWLGEQLGTLPVLYVASEMGGSTSLASMIRSPELPVACWYGAATVTDLATTATAVPVVGEQLVSAWGGVPDADQTVLANISAAPTTTSYRVVVPGPGAEDLRMQDAETLVSALEQSGHQVSQATAAGPLATTSEIDAADVTAMAEGCLG